MANLKSKERLPKRSHQWLDACDLKMARLIAAKIRRDPPLFQEAVETLRHWKRRLRPVPEAVLEWERIFRHNSRENILKILTQDNDEGQRLRQSDPFCGILTEEERLRFLDLFKPRLSQQPLSSSPNRCGRLPGRLAPSTCG